MMHTHPRHNIKNPPGQIVNKIETLGDYIKHVEEQEFPKKKLTFEEWLTATPIDLFFNSQLATVLEQCWKAAQENK